MTVRYKCMNCNYDFTMASDRSMTKCPYCGKPSLRSITRGPSMVDRIIRDS